MSLQSGDIFLGGILYLQVMSSLLKFTTLHQEIAEATHDADELFKLVEEKEYSLDKRDN